MLTFTSLLANMLFTSAELIFTFIRSFCPKWLAVIHTHFHTLMVLAAMQGADQHIRGSVSCPRTLRVVFTSRSVLEWSFKTFGWYQYAGSTPEPQWLNRNQLNKDKTWSRLQFCCFCNRTEINSSSQFSSITCQLRVSFYFLLAEN